MCGKSPRKYESGWIVRIPSCRRFEITERAERFERRHPNDTALEIPLGFLDARFDPKSTIPEIENTCDESEWPEIAMNMFTPCPGHAEVVGNPAAVSGERVIPTHHGSSRQSPRR